MTNVWKNLEVSKVYDALKSMTPEERLKDLYDSQKNLVKLSLNPSKITPKTIYLST